MRFTKMHGLGNDYVYVNGFSETVDDPASLAPLVSHRHFGIGSDGLILVLPPTPGTPGTSGGDAHVRMRMFNADGSESEMCGNGVRCVCKLAHDHGISSANPMRVQTGRGILTLAYSLDEDNKVASVTVDMGEPILAAADIPVELPGVPGDAHVINHPLHDLVQWPGDLAADWIDRCGFETKMTCVSMGNPHAVIYCQFTKEVNLGLVGPTLEHHPMFPRRTNVHLVEVHSMDEVTVRHWERGSGPTLACGTGACAVAVAGVLTGKTNRKITAHLPGGDLELEWRRDDNHVYMTGPAVEVFQGEWEPAKQPVTMARR